ncbi:MAG: IS110 family transposase [Luteolibacter sp.]
MKAKPSGGKSAKSKSRRPRKTTTKSTQSINTQTHPDAAGIDVGAEEFVAAVPIGRCDEPVRTYASFTSGVHALRDWLLECGITTAAMESTGNYWITLYDALTEAGIDVYLVNARHVKGVPGKKTDVCDAQWLQQLHAAGLLRKSFRPAPDIVPLRFLMRHRSEMVGDAAKQLQLMQKSLAEMNLKLQHVFSDIDGVSGQAIIDAILAGERDAKKLAALRDKRCRSTAEQIIEALHGDYREEYLFVLGQSRKIYQQLREAITRCDEQLGELTARVECEVTAPLPPAPKTQRLVGKNSPHFAVFETAWKFYGVDLGGVPGISAGVLCALISEVGTRDQLLAAFPTPERFASWMGLCPDNRISGGKVLKARTRKVKSRLAAAMRLGVFGLNKSQTQMGAYVRRMKGKLGKAEGITAAAHKLARIIHGMIKSQRAYDEKEAFKLTPQSEARRRKALEKQAAALGFTLQPAA